MAKALYISQFINPIMKNFIVKVPDREKLNLSAFANDQTHCFSSDLSEANSELLVRDGLLKKKRKKTDSKISKKDKTKFSDERITDFFKFKKTNHTTEKIKESGRKRKAPSEDVNVALHGRCSPEVSAKTRGIIRKLGANLKLPKFDEIDQIILNLPKKREAPSCADEAASILNSLSMKERFEGLLKRELVLPSKYKTLLIKLGALDKVLNSLHKSKSKTTLSNIQATFLSHRPCPRVSFAEDDFRQILHVVPFFFIYKYEKVSSKDELRIDVPQDIEARLQVKLILRLGEV